MVEGCVGPSELHLKREITALRKARLLRDPETCSSWRSPVSSKAATANAGIFDGNGVNGNGAQDDEEGLRASPAKCEKRRKKVYLYNWRHHSNKSSESGIKLDEDDQQSCNECNSECQSNSHAIEEKSDTYLEVPINIFSVAGSTSDTPVKRTRRSRKKVVSRKEAVKHSKVSKLVELPSSSLGIVNSGNPCEDYENCNYENLELTHKASYMSCSASPLFSAPGCAANILKMTKDAISSHSCTPVSTSSYYRYGGRNPSTIGSWDGTVPSFDGAELDEPALMRRQRCGIPSSWSKRSQNRGLSRCCSPSLSDTLRRKGTSLLCGSQRHSKKRSSSSTRRKLPKRVSQGLPLLSNNIDGAGSSFDSVSDELSTNFEELDLEALSRLDGRRWSSCKSQDGMELAVSGQFDVEGPEQRSLSQKYRPRSFDEIIGQNIVVQSLNNAILRDRIAPAYLFQGPRGTGKTSAAKVFSAALNCLATDDNKPCGVCKECTGVLAGTGMNMIEIDGTNKRSIGTLRSLLKNTPPAAAYLPYKVLVVEECHMISTKMWSALMKFLDEPLPRVVFIFITIDPDNLPRAVISRCQKFVFSKIKDVDIICRLRRISVKENLDVELDALDLIASNSDGSLRDAETMLDQLTLLGKKISASLVNDLVGVVSEEKLLDLLEIAMSSDTAETVKRSRELIDSGVDPTALMSQLAGLIMDIIAGTYRLSDSSCVGSAIGGRSLTEVELERLQQALKILSDAEKQIKFSSERSTWFTAALLQLGSNYNSEHSRGSSSKHSSRAMNNTAALAVRDSSASRPVSRLPFNFPESKQRWLTGTTSVHSSPRVLSSSSGMRMITSKDSNSKHTESGSAERAFLDSTRSNSSGKMVESANTDTLRQIWRRCIEQCHSNTLSQLLSDHGRLVSVQEFKGSVIALIALDDIDVKMRVERFLSSITNSFEMILRCNVDVRLGLISEFVAAGLNLTPDSRTSIPERRVEPHTFGVSAHKDRLADVALLLKNLDQSDGNLQRRSNRCESGLLVGEGTSLVSNRKGRETSTGRHVSSSADEQRLESAWRQTADNYPPGMISLPKPERNQVLPQNGIFQSRSKSRATLIAPLKSWDGTPNSEIKPLKTSSKHGQKSAARENGYGISPSLLHSNNYIVNAEAETPGYESGPGCNGLLCWKTGKHSGEKGMQTRAGRSSHISLFGNCGRPKSGGARLKN